MKRINKKGFTLVELLAVIVVLALLATVAITNVVPMMNKSKLGTTGSSLANIITSGFETCAVSQSNSTAIGTNCTADKMGDYVKNFDASKVKDGTLNVTADTISITYTDNDYKIVITSCSYEKAAKALANVKESYASGKATYTLNSSDCTSWSAS